MTTIKSRRPAWANVGDSLPESHKTPDVIRLNSILSMFVKFGMDVIIRY